MVEEVELQKDVGERTETVRDTTRRTKVEVGGDRQNAPAVAPTAGAERR